MRGRILFLAALVLFLASGPRFARSADSGECATPVAGAALSFHGNGGDFVSEPFDLQPGTYRLEVKQADAAAGGFTSSVKALKDGHYLAAAKSIADKPPYVASDVIRVDQPTRAIFKISPQGVWTATIAPIT